MEDQLYVRIRGRVQGPFDLEKLRALVKRGQLSRIHEVSIDGNDWQQASEYQELFTTRVKQTAQEPEQEPEAAQPEAQELGWYYSLNGIQAGPVSFEQLQAQASPGHLAPDDLVWKEGMKEWVPGSTIPGLLFGPTTGFVSTTSDSTSTSKLNAGLVRTLKDSQAWVRFIAFCFFLFFFFSFISGMYLIIGGILANLVIAIAWGIYSLFYAAVFFYGGWLLFSFRKQLQRVVKDRSMAKLDQALQTLRTFWMFISIILIVLLVNGIAGAIWALSVGHLSFIMVR